MSFSTNYFPSLERLQPGDIARAVKAIVKFGKNPDSPGLNLEKIKSDPMGRLHTIRASGELRILLSRLGDGKWVAEEVGHHDALYLRASVGRFVYAADGSDFGFHTALDAGLEKGNSFQGGGPTGKIAGRVLSHWTDGELLGAGLGERDVEAIRSCQTVDDLLDLDIDEETISLAIDLLETTPEKHRAEIEAPPVLIVVDDSTEEPLVEAIEKYGSEFGFSKLFSGEQLEKLLNAPIENWMIFLHPDQNEIVERVYAGPARIGGSAGTGKTVVALHRAANLARKFQGDASSPQILFTTYIRSLPPYFEKLYDRLPDSIPGAVRFIHIDGLAKDISRHHGIATYVDEKKAEGLFEQAYNSIATAESLVFKAALGTNYVQEEINAVIRGGLIENIEAYLEVERTGRKVPLQGGIRRQIWTIHEKYRDLKREQNVKDYTDVIEKALQISESTTPIFRSAIIDEAQDLSLMSLRFIRNLVNGAGGEDQEDNLLLVGDGAQRVYASCFTLAQAGLQVRGRSTILEVNYRNTHEIIEAALAVAGNREVDDLGTKVQVPTHTTSVLPSGSKPTLVVTNSIDQRNAYVAKRIRELYESKGYLPSDIGVLAPTNYLVNRFTKGLTRAGIPAVSMAYDRDHSADKLRVGTFYRAKGLEFKAVFLLGLENFPSRAKRGETEATYEDRHDLELNVIFVAMTRAREHLELVTLGAPSESVEKARDFLEPTSP